MKGPQTLIHWVSNPGPSGLKWRILRLDRSKFHSFVIDPGPRGQDPYAWRYLSAGYKDYPRDNKLKRYAYQLHMDILYYFIRQKIYAYPLLEITAYPMDKVKTRWRQLYLYAYHIICVLFAY